MSVFKCKMCGGSLEIAENQSVATCEYCGTSQTLPKLRDEKRVNLYDRANHFRRNNEFDKAETIYEQILNEDNSDSEAYWSLVLCRYGIEYVEDPASKKRIPTVNRAQFTSIFDDDNYKSALRYADSSQKAIYEEEANTINEIQKGILAISQKEEPFDVFICYKESDDKGQRTHDSVLANDLYHQLTAEGFKVFFARITLEDKLGTAYEPYIFAALNSAKVMVVIGTKPEYFNAVWVKNEWSRFLALVKKSGGKKILIPAYRDMDPYDLPEEFSHLQAQDMSKLGFMQDLIRGIKKLAQKETKAKPAVQQNVSADGNSVELLLKRAFMFIEDGDFASAAKYSEKVLDKDPENGDAYLAKLQSELRCRKISDFQKQPTPFDHMSSYQRIMQFGGGDVKIQLEDANKIIRDRNERARIEMLYQDAVKLMNNSGDASDYEGAANAFNDVAGYKDADEMIQKCHELADLARKEDIYQSTIKFEQFYNPAIETLQLMVDNYTKISGYKDADQRARNAQNRLEQTQKKKAAREKFNNIKKWTKRTVFIFIPLAIILFFVAKCGIGAIVENNKYEKAQALYAEGQNEEALEILRELGDYKESKDIMGELLGANRHLVQVGDTISVGKFVQTNSGEPEAINWRVLDVVDGRALILSDKAINAIPYHTEQALVTWEHCTLRAWLNIDFLNSAFTPEELAVIVNVLNTNPNNPEYGTAGGNDTCDSVFCLSYEEAEKYLSEDDEECFATEYVESISNQVSSKGKIPCWLRTPGTTTQEDVYGGVFDYYTAALITSGNVVNNLGWEIDGEQGVRPAMWISIAE